MATERQLFDKPPDELREAFVRNRFGEAAVFGRPDIEDWLAEQRTGARSPVRMWCELIQRNRLRFTTPFDVARLESLSDRSTIRVLRDLGVDERGNVDACYTLIGGLDERYADVYAVAPDLHLVVRKRRGAPYQAIAITAALRDAWNNPSPSYTIRPATDADFLRAVVILGLNPTSRQSRMRERARQFLCDALGEEIKRERAKAEADFDTAVAVSADGTKIVHADWVVVVDDSRGVYPNPDSQRRTRIARLFPAEAFVDQKIIRALKMDRVGWAHSTLVWTDEVNARSIAPALEYVLTNAAINHESEWQLYWSPLVAPRGGPGLEVRFFITPFRFCPSPLPDGGVEVTG